MGTTPEGKVKTAVKKMLEQFEPFGIYTYWPVPAGYGASSLDLLICFYGQFIAVETKAPGKKLTPRQIFCVDEIEKAVGHVFIIDGPNGVLALEKHLKYVLATFYQPKA